MLKHNTSSQQYLTEPFWDSGDYTTSHTSLIFRPHNYNLNIQSDLDLCTASKAYFSGLCLHVNYSWSWSLIWRQHYVEAVNFRHTYWWRTVLCVEKQPPARGRHRPTQEPLPPGGLRSPWRTPRTKCPGGRSWPTRVFCTLGQSLQQRQLWTISIRNRLYNPWFHLHLLKKIKCTRAFPSHLN